MRRWADSGLLNELRLAANLHVPVQARGTPITGTLTSPDPRRLSVAVGVAFAFDPRRLTVHAPEADCQTKGNPEAEVPLRVGPFAAERSPARFLRNGGRISSPATPAGPVRLWGEPFNYEKNQETDSHWRHVRSTERCQRHDDYRRRHGGCLDCCVDLPWSLA